MKIFTGKLAGKENSCIFTSVITTTNTTMETIKNNSCNKCGKVLNEETKVYLELSINDGNYYLPEEFPANHNSQGWFEFGPACWEKVVTRNQAQQEEAAPSDWDKLYSKLTKKELFKIAYNYAMLQADENEKEAIEFLKIEAIL